jgi:hypothetical protein
MNKSLLLALLLLSFLACKPGSSTETVKAPTEPSTEIQGLQDSLNGRIDTTVKAPTITENKETSKPHITDHICSPNFTLLAKPQANKQIFYVSGFDQKEFKCWEEIQKHAFKLCGDKVCTIYYVDLADIKVNPAAKDLVDPAVLKEHGVGRFVHDGKFWSLNGSSIWKRQGNGWAYYTTNNQFGG